VSTARYPLDTLRSEVARLNLDLEDASLEQFQTYLALLIEWRDRAGLTAITDPVTIQLRHFGESLALLAALRAAGLLPPGAPANVADIGTGAGFPGLPMRIAEPRIDLTLIESNGRRCRFLETVVEALGLTGTQVVQARAEEAGRLPDLRGQFDLVVARALAALPVLVEYALPLLREGGLLAAPKGSRARQELEEAAAAIEVLGGRAEEPVPLSLPAGAPPQQVLLVRRVAPLDDRFPRRPGMATKRPLR